MLIPALSRDDADVTLMFLASNSVTDSDPIYDPWFRATIPFNVTYPNGVYITEYSQDHYVNVLACADQFQFRNPALDRQTSLTSAANIPYSAFPQLGLNALQDTLMGMLYTSTLRQHTYFSVKNRGAAALRASDTLDYSTLV